MKLFQGHNDSELLYLIKEGNQDALDIMFNKYKHFINKKIRDFNINGKSADDFYQEGLITLYEAVKKYDEKYNKTFFKFFELLLVRKFSTLLSREQRQYEIVEKYKDKVQFDGQKVIREETISYVVDSVVSEFSELEKKIYKYYFKENKSTEYISEKLSVPKKTVYNAVARIKYKLQVLKNDI